MNKFAPATNTVCVELLLKCKIRVGLFVSFVRSNLRTRVSPVFARFGTAVHRRYHRQRYPDARLFPPIINNANVCPAPILFSTINVTWNYCKPINQILIAQADVFRIGTCDWLNLKQNIRTEPGSVKISVTTIDTASILIYVARQHHCYITHRHQHWSPIWYERALCKADGLHICNYRIGIIRGCV